MKQWLNQAVKFIGLSGVGWLLDFCVYTLLGVFLHNLVANNIFSSWVGVTFVFIFATRKVFQNNHTISLKWKYIIYIIYQAVLIFFISKLLNGINLSILSHTTVVLITRFSSIISKILVTPITMTLNFFVMKYVIEKL